MFEKLHYLHRAYRYRWRSDSSEIKFMCSRLRPGQVAVDVGCYKGAYTYWMRRSVGETGTVFAFEPQPKQAAYFRRMLGLMKYDNVRLEQVGLSSGEGRMPLYVPKPGAKTGQGATLVADPSRSCGTEAGEVRVTTLDAFFAGQAAQPDFIKIDVEGHELEVLQGARRTIENHHPVLLVECEARHRPDKSVRPVIELLESLGYTGSFFDNGRQRPLAEFDVAWHQRTLPDGRLPRGYANNFAFEHPGRSGR